MMARPSRPADGATYDVPDVTTVTSNAAAVRRRLRLPLIAALALAFISLSLISGIAYIVVLAGATNTAETFAGRPRRACCRCAGRRRSRAGSIPSPGISR